MKINANEKHDAREVLAWQILTVSPIMKKRLFRPDFEQNNNQLPLSYAQVLATLDQEGSMTVTEISERFDIAKPNITPLIDRMIEVGYVKRVRNSSDRRVVHVVILEKGREKVEEMIGSLKKTVSGWAGGMSGEDMEKLVSSIETIKEILEKSE